MRTKNKNLTASMLGFSMLLAACSGGGEIPEALAFQDDSSSDAVATDETTTDTVGTDEGSSDTAGADESGNDAAGADDATPEDDGLLRVNRPTGPQCGSSEYSIEFGDIPALLADTSPMSADFALDVPAGNYTIHTVTWYGFVEDPTQTKEIWNFTTDTGFTSPTTSDTSSTGDLIQSFGNITIDSDFTSLKLNHQGPGMGPNSVHPICIGFEPIAAPVTPTTEAPVVEETPTTEAPVVEEAPTIEAPVVEETPTTEAPVVEAAAETAPEAPAETTTSTEAPAVGAASLEGPRGPELALTGPSELATSLGLTGAALVLAGSAAVVAARRSEDD